MKNKRIDIMIAGAQKAGTTSLNKYLSQHPEIYTHTTIEFGMFANLEAFNKGFEYYYKSTVDDQVKKDENKTVFVAKRVGLMCNKQLLLKLKEHNPEVKIILVLRNPVERAFSAFNYCRASGMEPYADFNDAIYINDPARFNGNTNIQKNCEYIFRSSYLQHLKLVYSIFPAENIKVFLLEEMVNDYNKYLNEMIDLVHLENYFFDASKKYNERQEVKSKLLSKILSPGKLKFFRSILPVKQRLKFKSALRKANANKTGQKQNKQMDDDTKKYLQDLFRKDVHELKSFTRLPLDIYWPELF